MSGHRDAASRVQGLQRENGRLQEQLRGSEELNSTLRSELNLHRSIMAQSSSHHQARGRDSGPQDTHRYEVTSQRHAADEPRAMNPGKCETLSLSQSSRFMLQSLCCIRLKADQGSGLNFLDSILLVFLSEILR